MIINGTSAENAAAEQLAFQHNPQNTDGWITLAQKDPITKRFSQYHYKADQLAQHIKDWTGEDVYFSQNTFFKPIRRIDNIRQLRSLFVDLDVYNYNLTPEWVLGKLEFEYFRQAIPEPNLIIFSGRGLVLVWNIDPLPYKAIPLWRAVETYLVNQLKDLGADSKATDPARIFRLAGTINSKNGQVVRTEYRHSYRYDIHDLQHDYLPELPKAPKQKKARPQGSIINLFNLYSLHMTRARDIAKLVELREGDVTGYRETICFLYRYYICCCSADPERALEDTLNLNSEFLHPLPIREVKTATKSAERAWKAKTDAKANEIAKAAGYPGAGYNIGNQKLIDWLDITEEEQRHLDTIIGRDEKNRRRREKYQKQEGNKSRAEYDRSRKKNAAERADKLRALIEEHPDWTYAKLAEELQVSVKTIQRTLKNL